MITKWNLELRKAEASCFTSYAGLECRLIVHSFKPLLKEKLHPTRFPSNLYRDDEFKTTIQHYRHSQITGHAHHAALAPLSGGKGNVSQGIEAGGAGEWSFKTGKTAVVAHAGKSAAAGRASSSAPKVKGGAKHHAKAASKAAGKGSSVAHKVLKATPKSGKAAKAPGKESARPRTAGTPDAGKKSGAGGATGMTMKQYKTFLQNQKAKAKK